MKAANINHDLFTNRNELYISLCDNIKLKCTDEQRKMQQRPDLSDRSINITFQLIEQEMWIKNVTNQIQENFRNNTPQDGNNHIGDFVHLQYAAADIRTGNFLSESEIKVKIQGHRLYKSPEKIYKQFQIKYCYLKKEFDMGKIAEFLRFIQELSQQNDN